MEKRRLLAKLEANDVWEEIRAPVDEFIESPEYMNSALECWPSVKQDLVDLFSGNYDEAVFDEAIGSGKSYKASNITAYYAYSLLCLKNPQAYFGLARGSQINIINMSKTATQANKVVFTEIKSRINESPWFQKYFPPDPNVKSELRFPKNISVFPGNSKSTFGLGFNLILAIMDEAAWYTDNEILDVAEDMYYVLQRRIRNRFPVSKEINPLLVMISNPRYTDDFIERKMEEAKDNPRIFSRRRAIWESRPPVWNGITYWSGETFEVEDTQIPIELEPDFRKDKAKAWRDLGARPSYTLEPYYREYDKILKCVKGESPVDSDNRFKDWFKGKGRYKYNVHVDLGLKRDACGIAMGHRERQNTIIDLMIQIKPLYREIQFSDVRQVIFELRDRKFNINKVSYDGWQSVDSRQILAKAGFDTELLSINLGVHDNLKDFIYSENIQFYQFDPFLAECRRLELIKGTKVDHPPMGSKDVADAVAGVAWWCSQDVDHSVALHKIVQPKSFERTIFGQNP